MSTHESYCTFCIDDLHFGVGVRQVQEVIRHQQTTPVPLAPSVVKGLMNLRGQIVTTLDLRDRLGLPPTELDSPPMNVVIQGEEGPISLLVDNIGDVIEVDQTDFEPPPETVPAEQREYITGVYKLQDHLLLVLNTEAVTADEF